MSIEHVPGTALTYHLIGFDAAGRELPDDPDGPASRGAAAALAGGGVTDVFVFAHGWLADLPEARRRYGAWVAAMGRSRADVELLARRRPGFRPLFVGLHWPSRPWADGELDVPDAVASPAAAGSGAWSSAPGDWSPAAAGAPLPATKRLVDAWAEQIADTPAAREALELVAAAAVGGAAGAGRGGEVLDACLVLDREAGLGSDGPGAAPGADREPFRPERLVEAARHRLPPEAGLAGMLAPLRALAYAIARQRAHRLGEGLGRRLLAELQRAATPTTAFHLMGHGFGGIAVSAMLAGDQPSEVAPVRSLAVVHGTLSAFSYCADNPAAPGRPGCYHRAVDQASVTGPVVVTRSAGDLVTGWLHPFAAGTGLSAGEPVLGALPRYGALGALGARGLGTGSVDLEVRPAREGYRFQPGRVYNLETSRAVRPGETLAGAHTDVARAEVAHAVWQAALASAAAPGA